MLDRWGWDYVVRFRQDIHVTSAAGETKPARDWLSPKGYSKAMRAAGVTATQYGSLSLFNQGCYWFEALPNMREDRLELLMKDFGQIIREHQAIRSALGVL